MCLTSRRVEAALRRAIRPVTFAILAAMLASARASAQGPPRLPDLELEDLLGVRVQRVFGASERLQPVTEAPSSVTIVTADDIDRYGYRTLADILRGVRGFFVSDDRNYSYVGVRGFGRPGDYNSRVLLLVNGHKINDNVYDQAFVGSELGLGTAMFERVEIIRGPASSLYGTSAFFAVVNVITRSGGSLHGLTLEGATGTLGSRQARGVFGRTFGDGIQLALSSTYERSDGAGRLYFPAYDSPDTNHGVAEHLDGEQVAEAYGQLKVHDLTITATIDRRVKDVPTASFGSLFNSQLPRQQTTDRRTMIAAQYDHLAGRTRIAAELSFDRAYYTGVYPYRGDYDGVPLVDHDSAIGARWGIGGHATRPLWGRQTLTAGAEFFANITQKQWDVYDDLLVPGFTIDKSSNQRAVYVQDEVRIRPWLLVNAGVRHDAYERFTRTTPRGAVILLPSASQSFKYMYGQAFRAPNVYELYFYGDATASLQPEAMDTHEVVWEQYVGEWLRTSVSGYHYTASRLITFDAVDPDAAIVEYGFANDSTIQAKGLEFEAEVRSKRSFQMLGSYAVQRAEVEGGARLTNSPREMAKLRFSASGPAHRSVGSFEVRYLSPRRTLAGATVSAATVANVTFKAHVGGALELVGSIRNLFNQAYADPASDEHLPDAIQQNGRTARVALRWSLRTRR